MCISNNFAAQLALSFLQKDWLDERGSKQLKGPVFNKAVSIVLELFSFNCFVDKFFLFFINQIISIIVYKLFF